MYELSLHDIDKISRDIRRMEITFSHLAEDLIDHVCCDVENEMQNGLSYQEAYRMVKQKMGSRRLKEIQEETLYAVDTKYRKMKQTMKISGIAGTIMLGVAAVFKIMHLPGAGILLTLGALLLALVFMPSALIVLWKETHSGKSLTLFLSAFVAGTLYILGMLFKIQHWPGAASVITLSVISFVLIFIPSLLILKLRDEEVGSKRPVYIFGAIGLAIYITGFLFKFMHWPFASILMLTGLFVLIAIVFPWYTWLTWKDSEYVSTKFIFMVVAPLLFIVPAALVNIHLERSYEEGFFINQEQQQALFNYRMEHNASFVSNYKDSITYPEMSQLHSHAIELLSLICSIEVNMVVESEGAPGSPAVNPMQIKLVDSMPEIQYMLLTRPFHPNPVKDFLIPGCNSRMELENALSEYSLYLSGLSPGTGSENFTNLLAPGTYLPGDNPERYQMAMMSGLHSLELMKNSVLIMEAYSLSAIAKKSK